MKKSIFIFFLISNLILTSCSKEKSEIAVNSWKAEISNSNFSSLQDIYKLYRPEELKTIVSNKDEVRAREIILPIANEVSKYLYTKYNLDLSDEFENNPQGLAFYGLFLLKKEKESVIDNSNVIYSENKTVQEASLSCFITAVGSIIGIADAKAIWKSVMAGATEATAVAAAKLIFKRVAICVTSVFAIYEIGDCLDLW